MRIGYLLPDPGVDFGKREGCRVHVMQLIAGLRKIGHEVRMIALQPGASVLVDKGDGTFSPSACARDHAGQLSASVLSAVRKLGGSRREALRNDIVYRKAIPHLATCDIIHSRLALFDVSARLISQALGLPLVVEANAPLLEESKRYYPGIYKQNSIEFAENAMGYVLGGASHTIAVSNVLAGYLKDTYKLSSSNLTVIPNAADPIALDAEAASRLRSEIKVGTDPLVVFLGALQPWHGVDELLRSFDRVLTRHPRAKLLIVGTGRRFDEYEQSASRLGVSDSVRFTGAVTHEQAQAFLSLADVAVAPYPELSFEFYFSPLKIFEYMAAGKPIVASRIGQIAETIDDEVDGLLVEPGNEQELATKIIRLIENPDLRTLLGKNAQKKARNNTWLDHAAMLTACYAKQILHNPRPF